MEGIQRFIDRRIIKAGRFEAYFIVKSLSDNNIFGKEGVNVYFKTFNRNA